jgi:hypothetical protein
MSQRIFLSREYRVVAIRGYIGTNYYLHVFRNHRLLLSDPDITTAVPEIRYYTSLAAKMVDGE